MKIICIGRNYSEHAKELNNEVPDEPVIFLKPETAVLLKKQPFFIPDFSQDVHYEVEIVVKINRLGKHIEEKFAHKYYDEIGLGIDFTARDLQAKLKSKGLPWERAKGFDGSAVVGTFVSKNEMGTWDNVEFKLLKNKQIVQHGFARDMIFSVDKIIAFVSQYFTLKIGDLIFTGTPAGVGKIEKDDFLEGFLIDKKLFEVNVK